MQTTYTATQKYVQMTPRKVRLIADSVKKMTPAAAVQVLPYSNKRAANPLMKVIKTAIANAVQVGIDPTTLVFSEIQITQGPVLKRFIAVSRGQAHPLKKRMSHIRVVLSQKAEKKASKVVKAESPKVEVKVAPKKAVKSEKAKVSKKK